jgi:hypothetical protein
LFIITRGETLHVIGPVYAALNTCLLLPPRQLIDLRNGACIQESVACGFGVLGVSIDGTS